MFRHFFALWPDDDTRQAIASVSGKLPAGSGRLVPPGNLHITLAFLGPLEEGCVLGLRKEAAHIKSGGFTLTLERLGWWKKPGVAWIAPVYCPDELTGLVSAVNTLANKRDIELDNRAYQAHLTIARKVKRRPVDMEFRPIRWKISSFSLVQSRTLQEGAVYEVIETWPLLAR